MSDLNNIAPAGATTVVGNVEVTNDVGNPLPVSGSVTVSGTVTANQGTANTIGNRWPMYHTDGTNSMPTGDTAKRPIFVNAELNSQYTDEFNQLVVGQRANDFEVNFATTGATDLNSVVISYPTGSSSVNVSNGQAVFSTGATNPSRLMVRTLATVDYRPGSELYAYFTAYWTGFAANTFQRIGIFDGINGFFIGYEGDTFGVSRISGGNIVTTLKGQWNTDQLVGAAASRFTRLGTPESIDFTKQNVFRIRFGWVGSAPIIFEVLSPDGNWVSFHQYLIPNSQTAPTIQTPNLPIMVWMSDNGQSLSMGSSCWAGGSSSQFDKVSTPVSSNAYAQLTKSVVFGKTSSGNYIAVPSTPDGSLVVSSSDNIGQREQYYRRNEEIAQLTQMVQYGEALASAENRSSGQYFFKEIR
jgi:hypothetical protein